MLILGHVVDFSVNGSTLEQNKPHLSGSPWLLAAVGLAKVAAPLVAKVAGPEPYDPNPQYTFSYDVHVSQSHKKWL